MRRTLVVGVVVAMAAACHRQPKAVIEYGETVTYTSTANDPVPQPVAPAPVAASDTAPATPAAEEAPAAAETPEPAAPANEGGWTTSVQSPAPPAQPAAASEASEPSEPSPPAAPRQWYKAKPW
jgi:hypothetical protein